MRIVTGNAVRGEDFYNRENIIAKAWDFIESGSHLLIAAPRRIGKTSVMFYLRDHPKSGYTCTYLDSESVNNENEFFRRLVNRVLKTDFVQKSQKVLTFLEKHMPTVKKVGPEGIEFGISDHHDYFEMFIKILKSSRPEGQKLIIMLDEFPETLENIINDDGENAGRHFLQSNRELRQDPEINDHVRFIYTGSIGLENIVSKLNAVNTINDLSRLEIPPLKENEAKELINLLIQNVDFTLSDKLIGHILSQIEWYIPFYIQLIIEQLRNLYRDENLQRITKEAVDHAFTEMLKQRNHFEHWHLRLRSSIKGDEYNFVKELLNIVSENNTIHSNEIFNLAVKYHLENSHKDLLGTLIYDGYINNNDDPSIYRYNSPILRMWWRRNVAN